MLDSIRFQCQPGCIKCCDQKGYVYLTEQDVVRLAAYRKMTISEFETCYVFRTRKLIRLRTPRHSQCHFLTSEGCSVHEAKPAQCRAFPFWPELIDSKRAWKDTAKFCPGIGKGDLIQIDVVQAAAGEMREAHASYYASKSLTTVPATSVNRKSRPA